MNYSSDRHDILCANNPRQVCFAHFIPVYQIFVPRSQISTLWNEGKNYHGVASEDFGAECIEILCDFDFPRVLQVHINTFNYIDKDSKHLTWKFVASNIFYEAES